MKKTIFYITLACLLTCPVWASYTYVVNSYQYIPNLHGTESLLVIENGGGNGFQAEDNSLVTVESTSALGQGTGGLWQINLADSSHLSMSGGQVNFIDIGYNSTVFLSGGLIQQIWSQQDAWKQEGDPPAPVPNPHITIVYSGDLPMWSSSTNILTGLWGNGDPFSIQLIDVANYSPAIENIQFELIPEPATLTLLGLGGLWLRKRRL